MKTERIIRKTAKLFLAGAMFFAMTACGQNKTFTGTLENYICGDDRCSFGIKKSDGNFYDENITLEYDATGNPKLSGNVKDIVVKKGEYEELNPKYIGTEATITCTLKNKIYYVTSIELKNPNQTNTTNINAVTQTDWSIYEGQYVFNKNYDYYSIGKFPENTVIQTQYDGKVYNLPKEHVGKYFMVQKNGYYKTNEINPNVNAYIGPNVGNFILNIGGDGTITIQNYDNYGTNKDKLGLINLGGTLTYGKFEKRADGHYDLIVNNARYVWTKK